ncbi:MAG: DUF4837 family protein [Candidatus Marinimicrobia bacterium]|nr:DUF4837 family protein [Candidatus Neomarinimicrobiota bacterium]
MKFKLLVKILAFTVIILSVLTCEKPKENAIGYDHVITVVCDEDNWEACESVLNETLGKVYKTPRTENLYTFHRIDAEDLSVNILNKNLMILTRLEVYSEVTPQVRSMLPDSTITRIREDPHGYYYQEDAYAQGQALLVVAGKSVPDLANRLRINQDQIFEFIERKMFERNTAFVYRSGEQSELAESYFEQYGYYLRMMHDYVEIENSPQKQFVWLGRDFPYRWLSVTWSTPDDSTELENQLEILLKNTFESKMGSIRLNQSVQTRESFWFQQYAATKFYGLWESKEEIKGGPFIAYGFYEPVKDRIYLLSGVIHAPQKDKIPYLRQMETIFRTFNTEVYHPE